MLNKIIRFKKNLFFIFISLYSSFVFSINYLEPYKTVSELGITSRQFNNGVEWLSNHKILNDNNDKTVQNMDLVISKWNATKEIGDTCKIFLDGFRNRQEVRQFGGKVNLIRYGGSGSVFACVYDWNISSNRFKQIMAFEKKGDKFYITSISEK